MLRRAADCCELKDQASVKFSTPRHTRNRGGFAHSALCTTGDETAAVRANHKDSVSACAAPQPRSRQLWAPLLAGKVEVEALGPEWGRNEARVRNTKDGNKILTCDEHDVVGQCCGTMLLLKPKTLPAMDTT